ncbi:response regulator transcription factor [Streptomyces thioluteus]|uniref:Response regulator transcription factor n=1 Tax=Streptomyces thioluteus TaxID=66431 RepID=A0ABN3WKR7_STRTU
MDDPVRVVLVDDHPTVRAGTRAFLEPEGFTVVGEAGCERQAVAIAAELRPDLLMLDMRLESGPALRAVPRLLLAAPGMRILVHSMYEDPALVRGALTAGASGYLLKNSSLAELVLAARTVASGRRYVQPSLGACLAQTLRGEGELPPRERQVLELLADGYTNREVAARLTVSVRTVESVRAALRTRLGLVSRADLVAYARRRRDAAHA